MAGCSIPGAEKNVKARALKGALHRWCGGPIARENLMPHIKTYCRCAALPEMLNISMIARSLNKFRREHFHCWCGGPIARQAFMPHIKTYCRCAASMAGHVLMAADLCYSLQQLQPCK